MPIMNGYEATKRIRQMEKELKVNRPLRIIGVSANSRDTYMNKAMQVGMDGYIRKPFQKTEVMEAVFGRTG
ncbi:hypothetical protein PROFUN_01050 [Planoprotostelium fungivorum]|uniref:Response regulatory domain-containing protein n=1 Tax=Planoprotostelium fungivorum TaxID=1890364 RepID=A0A2P6N4K0_9EUKA|nr:hypothetical protein PROFUN_01050 [Planoprotostelium fungivorum]